ncbi:MAG: hypothetical protein OXT72_01850 [Gammaproteobacteria bacterium]|nr:hypothetical protein [Gammaproteobacteria bacterium]MDE0246750.1 hypothetical protein [Gammaproteobacteria bacterium]
MDVLAEEKGEIEKAVYFRLADLDVNLIFYDTTSVHFEIEDQDPEGESLARRWGHSKNGRRDAAQVVVGLTVTRDGFPVRHWVFSGNTVDVSTVGDVKKGLRGWRRTRWVFMGDAGMVSKDNPRTLSRGGGRLHRLRAGAAGGKIYKRVLSSNGRKREVGLSLLVKEVVLVGGERRERCAVWHNPGDARRGCRHHAGCCRRWRRSWRRSRQRVGVSTERTVCERQSGRRYGR